jgi:hypothetical protein
MDSEKYKIYKDIFIEVKKYKDREYVAFVYGFDDIKSSAFETEEDALAVVIRKIDVYLKWCADKRIIPRKPVPSDCHFLDSSRGRADIYKVTREECISLQESLFSKESSFALSAMLNKNLVFKDDGSFFVDFSKFLRESKFVDANKHVVFAPLTKKIYDIYYTLNYLYGIFQIYVDSTGLLIVEYDRRKIEYGRVYELEYEVYGESKGRGYLVIHRHGLFDNCEFKGFHNLIDDFDYRSNSAILEDYQVLSKLLPDSDIKIHEKLYKLEKFRITLLLRQSIELDFDSESINKFIDLAGNTFIYFLSHYVFKYNDFVGYEYENIKLDRYKVYSDKHKFIEDAKIYKQNYEQDVLEDIIDRGCQNEREFEVLKMYLAGTEFISAMSKNQFDVIKILATNAAWIYVGKISDINQILSVIAIKKIDGKSDKEIYDEVKSVENFVNIHELLGIRAIKQDLGHKDKFIKRIINKYVAKLADEYHIPKPKLRERSVR